MTKMNIKRTILD